MRCAPSTPTPSITCSSHTTANAWAPPSYGYAGFVRCHRRAAVQLAWIERVVPLDKGDGKLLRRGGARVPYSRQYRAAVLARL